MHQATDSTAAQRTAQQAKQQTIQQTTRKTAQQKAHQTAELQLGPADCAKQLNNNRNKNIETTKHNGNRNKKQTAPKRKQEILIKGKNINKN